LVKQHNQELDDIPETVQIPIECSGDVLKTLRKRLKPVLQAKLEEIDIKYEARFLSLARPIEGTLTAA
jgi:hypothetical protein